ncbi:MAG: maltose alpha-D-glucosyltransferase, partial [Chitinivibrionales bacterium]|nr:maltose alpha-D-glucosyltransferase [Chitinivibrionales bacterium]
LKDDGYDIADYYSIRSDYGTIREFKKFLSEAHKRDIRVIAELVINHTSSEHPWFQKARSAKEGSAARRFYVWSKTPTKYQETRIIFKDFESSNWSYDAKTGNYFWHRFYSHQPDLNFDNPEVRRQVLKVLDHWFGMGVDGLRLDAIPYLFEREGTNCENLPETHAFLKDLRAHVNKRFPGKMLLAEANQWPEDAVEYFGEGDECHMSFHFPLMPRLFMAMHMEDSFPIIDILKSTPPIPESCQWAMFLRNHDELTLEMVTDEERDYMTRAYAQDPTMKINLGIRRRLAPLLENNRRKIEALNMLLFSFPGTPVIYYGDEIGMGDNHFLGDRNGVRTPMQWSADKNAGFSDANPQRLYLPTIIDPQYHYEATNVENQIENPSSLFWWMKRVIAMRRKFKVFGRGDISFVGANNSKVLAFTRTLQDEKLLVVVNLSRFMQVVSLDLQEFSGLVPEELFSRNRLEVIRKRPYSLTLGAYDAFWFMLQKRKTTRTTQKKSLPLIKIASENWRDVLKGSERKKIVQTVLPAYLQAKRWFRAKSLIINDVQIADTIAADGAGDAIIVLIAVRYKEGADEVYLLPLSFEPVHTTSVESGIRPAALCLLRTGRQQGYLYDASGKAAFQARLLELIYGKQSLKGRNGAIKGLAGKKIRSIMQARPSQLAPQLLNVEQSNTSILFGDVLFLKLYRKLEDGINPEIDMLKFLTENTSFTNIPLFAGALEYHRKGNEPATVGLLQGYAASVSDSWKYATQTAGHCFEQVLTRIAGEEEQRISVPDSLFDCDIENAPEFMKELNGGLFYEMMALLGRRTGEMHCALASSENNEYFKPENFSQLYQRSLYQSIQSQVGRNFQILKKQLSSLSEGIQTVAQEIAASEKEILRLARKHLQTKFDAQKVRIHGDYHLGQVLFTGKDFLIIDFEGEPARSLGERKLKYSCFRDVAGMVRSLHYAAYSAVFLHGGYSEDDIRGLEPYIDAWYAYAAGVFLQAYFDAVGDAAFVPSGDIAREKMLSIYLLEKSVYELAYELNNRPSWAIIPMKGFLNVKYALQRRDS